MPVFEYECLKCQNEWEDLYLTKEELPTNCPSCKSKRIRKLISLTANGVVELTGHELTNKLNADAHKLVRESERNENLLANLVGETKYQNNLSLKKELSQTRPKIKRSKKSQ